MWAECYPLESGRVVARCDAGVRRRIGTLGAEHVVQLVDASDRAAKMLAYLLAARATACSLEVAERELEQPKDLVHDGAPSRCETDPGRFDLPEHPLRQAEVRLVGAAVGVTDDRRDLEASREVVRRGRAVEDGLDLVTRQMSSVSSMPASTCGSSSCAKKLKPRQSYWMNGPL